MASVILSSAASHASSAVSSYIGLDSIPVLGDFISKQIKRGSSQLAKQLGNEIDSLLFGENEEHRIRGARLNDLSVQTSTYGKVIPLTFGKVRLAGNIIWASKIKEIPVTNTSSSGGGKGGSFGSTKRTTTSYNYTVSFAISICEGEIDDITRIWANSQLINISQYCNSFEIHKGSETQQVSAIIESFEGINKTPAYKNIAYIVFEDFDISAFGNRIPNLTFEINKPAATKFSEDSEHVENMVKQITLIPGSGEFVYDTEINNKIYGRDIAGKWIQSGAAESINLNNANNEADVIVSLKHMQKTLPNLEWVSVVCTWFADSLDIANANIYPKVEYKTGTITEPNIWQVGNYVRENAQEITKDANGKPIYGGTPSDSSILNLITELKNMGYKVMLYPMVFINQPNKPWRGKLTGDINDISSFFNNNSGYNNFIKHYAQLTRNKVDAFIIGSEMKGLTSLQDQSNNSFPAVDEFISLASEVKSILGSNTKISYAADWSEYHSVNNWFNMDKLWANENIDFIGIDAYFPLTDEPQKGVYNLQNTINGWTSGEGFNWYYTDESRTNKANYSNPLHAWKNIQYWWENTHSNPDGSNTNWVARSKKIWFTEYGFPSIDGATNQPNIFYNPESEDSGIPNHSKGQIDFLAQRLGIKATLLQWQDSEMVENKFLWAWDARPYPFWPDLSNIWADHNVWSKGHWVQGKLGISFLSEIITEICKKSGLSSNDINVNNINEIIEGYVLQNRITGTKALETITESNFIFKQDSGDSINFLAKKYAPNIKINIDNLLIDEQGEYITITSLGDENLAEKIDINYIDSKSGYLIGNQHAQRDSKSGKKKHEVNLPIVMPHIKAKKLAEQHLLHQWASNKIYELQLDKSYINIEIGDNLELVDNQGKTIHNLYIIAINFTSNNNLQLKAINYIKSIYEDYSLSNNIDGDDTESANGTETINQISKTRMKLMNLPTISGGDHYRPIIHAAITPISSEWSGAAIYVAEEDQIDKYKKIIEIENKSIIGNIIENIEITSPFITDINTTFDISIISGELESKPIESIFNSESNLMFINGEIIRFSSAELIDNNIYRISGIMRGQFGTEHNIAEHIAGSEIAIIDENITVLPFNNEHILQELYFKAVSFGKALEETETQSFTITGENLKPYRVANVNIAKNNNGDITVNFDRRSRLPANWALSEVPLAEQSEKYEIDILNNDNEVIRTIKSSQPSIEYLESQQLEDFGEEISHINANIFQISDIIGRNNPVFIDKNL